MKLKLVGIFVCLLAGLFVSCGSTPKCPEGTYQSKDCDTGKITTGRNQSPELLQKPSTPKVDAKNYQIAWWANDVVGAEEAKKSKMPMYVLITHYKNCAPCEKMDDTLNDIRVIELLNKKFVCVKTDMDNDAVKKYKIRGYPENFFLNYDGTHIGRRSGYVKTSEEFTKLLNKVLSLAKE